ncbi:signal transduction histidine kinase [Desulfosalsimonas propionicica]|uniref:Signal transduction histidine kinase n=2 Tax=Desulfosalsimonas propionicica TaxID=332175 RepID=A0A7W0C982_9BACT|nr:signal transduction histidine kinase [Desulfosalsimonas propionicica]
MEQAITSSGTLTEPWSSQAVFLARDLCVLRTKIKQLQQEQEHVTQQKRLMEQMTSLLASMLDYNSKSLNQMAAQVHTFFDTLGGHSAFLKAELSEELLQSFRASLLLRIRRSQFQMREIRTTIINLPRADDELPQPTDVNQILKKILIRLCSNHDSKIKVRPSLDERITPQKYPPKACHEAFKALLAWRLELAARQGERSRFHVRTKQLSQYIEISLWDNGGSLTDEQIKNLYDPLYSLNKKPQRLAWAVHCLEIIIGGHVFFHDEDNSMHNSRMIILLPLTCQ